MLITPACFLSFVIPAWSWRESSALVLVGPRLALAGTTSIRRSSFSRGLGGNPGRLPFWVPVSRSRGRRKGMATPCHDTGWFSGANWVKYKEAPRASSRGCHTASCRLRGPRLLAMTQVCWKGLANGAGFAGLAPDLGLHRCPREAFARHVPRADQRDREPQRGMQHQRVARRQRLRHAIGLQ